MADRIVKAEEAQAHLKDLLDLVKEGEEVLISEDDKVFARIAPVKEAKRKKGRTLGLHRGVVKWIAPDFDEPLPDSFWLGDEESSS